MHAFLRPFLIRWRLVALIYSAAMLAIAHAFETFGHLEPCHLCLIEREVYWAAMAISAASMVIVRLPGGPRWRAATDWVLALVFAASAGIAGYHAGVEWKFWPGPTTCTGAGTGGVSAEALSNLMNGAKIHAVMCDQAAWVFLGISMAGWNALISLKLTILSILAALQERGRDA